MKKKEENVKLIKSDLITRSDSDARVFSDKLSANALLRPQLGSQLYESACVNLKNLIQFSLICQKYFLIKQKVKLALNPCQ